MVVMTTSFEVAQCGRKLDVTVAQLVCQLHPVVELVVLLLLNFQFLRHGCQLTFDLVKFSAQLFLNVALFRELGYERVTDAESQLMVVLSSELTPVVSGQEIFEMVQVADHVLLQFVAVIIEYSDRTQHIIQRLGRCLSVRQE